jgi:DNA-binding NtrC family response regulator
MNTDIAPKPPIIVVDDEPEVLESFELILNSDGYDQVITCRDSREVAGILSRTGSATAILLDLVMPYLKGEELLPILSEHHPEIPVIVITATDKLETAVGCMKAGAFDYLVKPVETMRLLSSVRRAVESTETARENQELKRRLLSESLDKPDAFEQIITRNPKMLAIFRYIEAIATTKEPVLITGATGVGKELVARAIHTLSGLPGPFVAVNVAGLDDHAFSDTLFGHKKGAFTGVVDKREGLVKKADNGSLFLDEIGDLSPASQIKLLRLLQEKEYYTLGSDLPHKSGARILAASNRNLEANGRDACMRRDLFYRLQTHQVSLPPLHDRLADLPLLVDHFLERAAKKLGKKPPTYPPELIPLLRCHPFPGNIRELQTMILDAVGEHQSGVLSLKSFKKRIFKHSRDAGQEAGPSAYEGLFAQVPTLPTLEEATQLLIDEALARAGNNQSIASRFLGISQPALSRRLKYRKQKE